MYGHPRAPEQLKRVAWTIARSRACSFRARLIQIEAELGTGRRVGVARLTGSRPGVDPSR